MRSRLISVLCIIVLIPSCQMMLRLVTNTRKPKVYKTREASHEKIVNTIERKGINNYQIVYRSADFLEEIGDTSVYTTNVKIFNSKGQQPDYIESVALCEDYSFKHKAFTKYGYNLDSVQWRKTNDLANITNYLEKIDSTRISLSDSTFKFFVLMDYTTFSKGFQNRALRDIQDIPQLQDSDSVFYLFLNKDIIEGSYYWNYRKTLKNKQE